MIDVAVALWLRAVQSLAGASTLLGVDPDGAASRAYYAAFQAVSALFVARGKTFSNHKAIEAAVHRDLVLAKEWDARLGADYSYLHRLRNTGDYGGLATVNTKDAVDAIATAQRILDAVRQTRPEIFKLGVNPY